MRLSKNFTLKELTYSSTGLRLGIENEPSKEGVYKLRLLATLLQQLRNKIGALRITSGYRSPKLNTAIGGSTKSQHCKYEAVDLQYFKRGEPDNLQIYNTLIELDIDFDQCILEFGDSTEYIDPSNPAWVHLSYKINSNRRQVLIAYKDINNKTRYRPLIKYNSI